MGKAVEAGGAAAPWVRTAQQVAQDLEVSTSSGLSAAQVEQRRKQYGYNELAKEEATPLWKLVLEQFNDMLVKVGGLVVVAEGGSQQLGWSNPPRAAACTCAHGTPNLLLFFCI